MKFSEEQMHIWSRPAGTTENTRMENARDAVVNALKNCPVINDSLVQLIDKGSSHNNTNVKAKADVDLSVKYLGISFFYGLPHGYTPEHFGIIPSSESYVTHKNAVKKALYDHFDATDIDDTGNKCTRIVENTYRVDTDVVPVWEYRQYRVDGKYDAGVAYYADDGVFVINFPEQHTTNGREKNIRTGKRYKRIVRILKRMRDKMAQENVFRSESITSFLIECLVWNVPDEVFNEHDTLSETLRDVLVYIYSGIENSQHSRWSEVSNLLPLFSTERKWSSDDAQAFVLETWKYAEYK